MTKVFREIPSGKWRMLNTPEEVRELNEAMAYRGENPYRLHDEVRWEEVLETTPNYKDSVNHPPHYTSHPSGIECIQITEHMTFCLGNAVKYIWRADLKHDAIEDLEKAKWYIEREIAKRKAVPPDDWSFVKCTGVKV